MLFPEKRRSLFYFVKITPESKDLPNIYSNCVFYFQIVHPGTFTQCNSDLEYENIGLLQQSWIREKILREFDLCGKYLLVLAQGINCQSKGKKIAKQGKNVCKGSFSCISHHVSSVSVVKKPLRQFHVCLPFLFPQ